MAKSLAGKRPLAFLALAIALLLLVVAACSPAAAPAPTTAPAKPAAPAATTAPAAPAAPAPTTAAAPAKPAGPAVTLRAGASDPEGTTAPSLGIGRIAELATKKSNGELNVQAHYVSLGVEQQLAEAIKAGSVDIGFTATSNLARFTDAFLQFDLPFLFKNDRSYIETLKTSEWGKKAIAQFEKDLGVKVLAWTSHTYDAPVSGTDLILRNKQAKVPADIKGLKLRATSSPVEQAIFKAYGANPTPVDYAQVYSALQQGVVDGNGVTPITPAASIKLYEVCKYYTAVGFRFNLLPIYMNKAKFDSLSPTAQKALVEAGAETEAAAGADAVRMVNAAIKAFEDNGVKIYYPNKDEMAQWMSIKDTVWKQMAQEFPGKIDYDVAMQISKLPINQR